MDWPAALQQVIGKPFKWGARGPAAYDCWGLVLAARRLLDLPCPEGIDTPDEGLHGLAIAEQIASGNWIKVLSPQPGDVAAIGTSMNQIPNHVGLVTPFGILHTTKASKSCIQQASSMKSGGWRRMEFYRWAK
jgi:cell wall-associated NlpC family hydrolase